MCFFRPRSGDFTYTDDEMEVMLADIEYCKTVGCNGIVSGILNRDSTIDVERTAALVNASEGMHFTFHRAFDWVPDPFEALEQLEHMGCKTILTSGQATSAVKGIDKLLALKEKATHCTIMPGGGIRAENVYIFKDNPFNAIHFSASVLERRLDVSPEIPMNNNTLFDETVVSFSCLQRIKELVDIVK